MAIFHCYVRSPEGIRNYSYLEYAGIQSCPLIGKKSYIEYVLFLEDFRRSILEDPIPKNSAPPKTWAPTMDHRGSFHRNRELSSISSVSFYNLNIFRRHSCRFPPFCRDNLERNAGGRECVIKSAKFLCFSIKI